MEGTLSEAMNINLKEEIKKEKPKQGPERWYSSRDYTFHNTDLGLTSIPSPGIPYGPPS